MKLLWIFLLLTIPMQSQEITQEYILENYSDIADKIIEAALEDTTSYDRLAYFCDYFGHRLSGSENLERSLKWIEQQMKADSLENVRAEEVMVPHWVRGNEYCKMLEPWKKNISMVGLGGSIGTPKEGITADVIVVKNYDDLKEKADKIKGKIVVYNEPFKHYGQAANYRVRGAMHAARYGAVASLIRSASPIGMSLPHGGMMLYADTIKKIPHAALSHEDADLFLRLQNRGITPQITLYMEAETLPDAPSANVIGELVGSEKKNEYLAIGGHIDSWDLGTGAHDDASGCLSSWQAVKLMKDLGLRPRRTVRAVMWVNEENGLRGGRKYAEDHGDEMHALVFEFDSGCFPPSEIRYRGPEDLFEIVKYMQPLLQRIDSIKVIPGGGGVDISPMMKKGIPAMSLNTEDEGKYFWYHHSAADTIDKIDDENYRKCVAAIALAIYIYADLPINLIRKYEPNSTR